MRAERIGFIVVMGLLLAVPIAFAVQYINGWEVYREEDGLTSNDVVSVFIADEGVKWFGVRGPLNTFDDEEWGTLDVYGVWDMKRDASGDIWVLEYATGPRRFKNGAFEEPPGGGRRPVPLASFDFDTDGRLWVAGSEHIAWHDLSDTGNWRYLSGWTTGYPIYPPNLVADPDGTVWVSCMLGLFRIRDVGDSWVRFFKDIWCTGIDVTSDGTKWVSADGTYRSDDGESWEKVWTTSPSCIKAVQDKGVFFSFYWYDYEQRYRIDAWAPDVFVQDIAVDYATGDVWFASRNAGVGVLRGWFAPSGPPILLDVATDETHYSATDLMRVSIDLMSDAADSRTVDFYVALELPSGALLFYPSFWTEMTPFLSGVQIPADTHLEGYDLFSLTLPDLPAGTYRWFAACTHAGTMDFASNIASCEWEFVR